MKYRTFDEVLRDQLKDPEFKQIWEGNALKREITSTIIGERIKRKMTQQEVAQKAGIKQPSLARVESGGVMPSIRTLERLAAVFGRKLEIRFA
jgi:DNA-binding XRE family transcriptional regulator